MVLVAAAIVSVGVSEFYFTYEDSKRAVAAVEADKASSAAVSIDQFIGEILGDLDTVAASTSIRPSSSACSSSAGFAGARSC